MPLIKTALPRTDESYQEKDSGMHILFSGTKVIQIRKDNSNPVLALVIRTGYSTSKGNLVRSILYPPPVDYKFEKGVYKFITIIGVLSGFASAISAGIMVITHKYDNNFIISFHNIMMILLSHFMDCKRLLIIYVLCMFDLC